MTSITSATRKSPATVTMSGRGTITSRTTVSPNSMIDSMSARSSSSITPSSTPSSATASNSSSDTYGPCASPLPGRSRLVRPMSARDAIRSGENRTRARMGRAAASAERSGLSTAHVRGSDAATTNTTTTSTAVAITTPVTPHRRSAPTPTSVGCTPWQPRSTRSTAFTYSPPSTRRPRWRSRPRSSPGSTLAGLSPPVVEPIEQVALACLHRRGLVGLGVVVPQHVEYAVHHQQRQLVVVAAGVVGSLALGDRRADDHVAEEERQVRLASYALGEQHLAGQFHPPSHVDRGGVLLVGPVHLHVALRPVAARLGRRSVDLGLVAGLGALWWRHQPASAVEWPSDRSYASTMSCTMRCRTTSRDVRRTNSRPSMSPRMRSRRGLALGAGGRGPPALLGGGENLWGKPHAGGENF